MKEKEREIMKEKVAWSEGKYEKIEDNEKKRSWLWVEKRNKHRKMKIKSLVG